MDFLAGRNASVSARLHTPATVGSVTYTLYNHAGAPISGVVDIAITTTVAQTVVIVSIGSANLTITSPRRFEKRLLRIDYVVSGQSFSITKNIRVIPLLNATVTPGDVRAYIGLNEGEVPDDDVDILSAYLAVETLIGKTLFDTALISGTVDEQNVNKAIKLKIVIDLIPSLSQRMAQSETNGIIGFSRQSRIDFSKLLDAAKGELTDIITGVGLRSISGTALVQLTQPTDVITGR